MLKKVKFVMVVILILSFITTAGIFSGCKGQSIEKGTEEVAEEATDENPTYEEETREEETGEEPTNEEIVEVSTEPIQVVDGIEDEITLEKPAGKVIVFAPSTLEIIDAIGGMNKVVGVDNWSVDNKEPLAEGFEGFGDYQGFNMEKIIEVDPDLLIVLSGNSPEDIKKIKELGISVYTAEAVNFQAAYVEIVNVGRMLDLEDKAAQVKDEFQSQVDEIYLKVKDLKDEEKPKVFYEIFNDPLWSAGKDTFIDDLIEKAGGLNIVSLDGIEGYAEYSVEKLIENNPDIMISGDGGMYEAKTVDIILDDARFSAVNAVINKKVYIVPENPIVRPNQNSIKGLTMFAKAIHPEIFGEFEVVE